MTIGGSLAGGERCHTQQHRAPPPTSWLLGIQTSKNLACESWSSDLDRKNDDGD